MLIKDYPATVTTDERANGPRVRALHPDVVGLVDCESCERRPATALVVLPHATAPSRSSDFLTCGPCADVAVTR